MKIFLGLAFIVVLIIVFSQLDNYIATQMWVYTGGEEWHIVAEGWRIIQHAWLVALGLVFGGIVIGFWAGLGWLSLWADREDLKKARTRADTAEERAQADIAKERAKIKYREAEAEKTIATYKNECELADIKTKEAEKIAEDAEKRRVNAVAIMCDKKKTVNKLREKLKEKEKED